MPGLIAFKRRWATGSDDLVVPAFMLFLLHVILFIVIAIIIGTSKDLEEYATYDLEDLRNSVLFNETLYNKASCAVEIRNFSFGYLALISVAAVLEFLLTWFSSKGTILDPEPRKPVEHLIYVRIGFGIIELVFSIVSAVQISLDWKACGVVKELYDIQIGIIIINFIVLLIVLLVGYCVFDAAGGKYYDMKNASDDQGVSTSRIEKMRKEFEMQRKQTWLNRLSNCFCCVSNNSANVKQVALGEVSTLLHNFFKDYDFVLSDIIAGLTLLRHKQQCIENNTTTSECWCRDQVVTNNENNILEFMCGRPITPGTHFVDLRNTVTKKECEDMSHYCAFALAAYGPLFYCIENTGTGLCGVLRECLCGDNPTCTSPCCYSNSSQRMRKRVLVKGDSSCGWAIAGIKKSLFEHGVSADVVYVSLENAISKQPFFLCVDHERKSVVVTIRGTLAEADALTDLVASAESIQTEENDGTWKAHKGMVNGAEYIKKKLLEEDKVLSLGFGNCLAKGSRDYDLILVGHSLGAGIASILAVLLHPIYPNLKCYAYSPPGGLMSHSAMLASRDYIHTVIFGKDVVPRAGLSQLKALRGRVVDLLQHTDLPKYKIILGSACRSLEKRHGLLHSEKLNSHAVRVTPGRLRSTSAENTTDFEIMAATTEELYPPGKIYHLVYSSETSTNCRGKKTKKYHLIYGDNVSDFGEIVVSHQMISHHLPQEVLRCLKKALHNFPNDRVDRSYAQSATLPFTENRANSMQNKTNHNNYKNQETVTQQPSSASSPNPPSLAQESDEDIPDVHQPFLNTNQNNIVNVTAEIGRTTTSSSSHSSISSLLADAHAPLARPESFTLSLRSPLSPTTVFAAFEGCPLVEQDVLAKNYESTGSDSLLSPVPQACSTPFPATPKHVTDRASALLNGCSEEQDDSNISCDDLDIDLHGRNAVS